MPEGTFGGALIGSTGRVMLGEGGEETFYYRHVFHKRCNNNTQTHGLIGCLAGYFFWFLCNAGIFFFSIFALHDFFFFLDFPPPPPPFTFLMVRP